jgi:F0F1-type ATP synthase membrane subunit b/b'
MKLRQKQRNRPIKSLTMRVQPFGIEKQAALKEIRIQVAMFSLEVAERLLKEKLSNDKAQKDLVQKYVNDIKVN